MALLSRSAPPEDVRGALRLDGARLLAVAELVDGWVAATRATIHVLRRTGAGDEVLVRRWTDVDGARLDAETATLTVTWVDGTRPTEVVLADDRSTRFPRTLHERVQASVVHSETVQLRGRRTVRVVLRREPDGHLFTQVVGPGDLDLADPAVAAAVGAAEGRVREAGGLPA